MEYRLSERTELNIFFTNEEVSQIAEITDYITRLYPRLDEELLEISQAQAQEQAGFWRDMVAMVSDKATSYHTPELMKFALLEKAPDGFLLSLKGETAALFGLSLQYAAFDHIPDESSLSISKDDCRKLERSYYLAMQEKLIAYGAGPLLEGRMIK